MEKDGLPGVRNRITISHPVEHDRRCHYRGYSRIVNNSADNAEVTTAGEASSAGHARARTCVDLRAPQVLIRTNWTPV